MTKHIFRVPVDTQHFKDTIEEGKLYTEILPFFSSEEQLKKIAQGGRVRYWGSLPGESNKRTFTLLTEGDELLCWIILGLGENCLLDQNESSQTDSSFTNKSVI